jgi:hypothetical protein
MTDVSRVPPTVNLTLYAGDGVAIRFTMVDTTGNPFPLDGLVTSQIKAKRTDPDPLATWAVDGTGLPDGVIVLSLTGAQTEALLNNRNSFKGVWDLQFTPTGSEPVTLVQGTVECDADVTR